MIVTPYNAEAQSEHSQFQYLHISKEWDDSHSYRKFVNNRETFFLLLLILLLGVPYACKRKVEQCEQVSSSVISQLEGLIQEYKDYEQ